MGYQDERKPSEQTSEQELRFLGKMMTKLAIESARQMLSASLRSILELREQAVVAGFRAASEELMASYDELAQHLKGLGEAK
jgi:hypothetical protein